MSLRYKGNSGALRVHRLFSNAPDEVLEAIVVQFFTHVSRPSSRALRARIMDFVHHNRELTLATTALPRMRPPRGEVYDLEEVRDHVVRRFVPERRRARPGLRVGWSRRATPSLMGKWVETPERQPNLIVINRLLDDRRVPRFYVDYIVYHEVLHDLFPIDRRDGRWVQHPPEFRRRERQFTHFAAARLWERERLAGLLRRSASETESG